MVHSTSNKGVSNNNPKQQETHSKIRIKQNGRTTNAYGGWANGAPVVNIRTKGQRVPLG